MPLFLNVLGGVMPSKIILWRIKMKKIFVLFLLLALSLPALSQQRQTRSTPPRQAPTAPQRTPRSSPPRQGSSRYERPQVRGGDSYARVDHGTPIRNEEAYRDRRDFRMGNHFGFGRDYCFRTGRLNAFRGGFRFIYFGVWFNLYEPYPVIWDYSDEVYIEVVDNVYYLRNVRHPEV
jgi:hypothetical protein